MRLMVGLDALNTGKVMGTKRRYRHARSGPGRCNGVPAIHHYPSMTVYENIASPMRL
jgi:ABC-type sugar transport system ATPase subunit